MHAKIMVERVVFLGGGKGLEAWQQRRPATPLSAGSSFFQKQLFKENPGSLNAIELLHQVATFVEMVRVQRSLCPQRKFSAIAERPLC